MGAAKVGPAGGESQNADPRSGAIRRGRDANARVGGGRALFHRRATMRGGKRRYPPEPSGFSGSGSGFLRKSASSLSRASAAFGAGGLSPKSWLSFSRALAWSGEAPAPNSTVSLARASASRALPPVAATYGARLK